MDINALYAQLNTRRLWHSIIITFSRPVHSTLPSLSLTARRYYRPFYIRFALYCFILFLCLILPNCLLFILFINNFFPVQIFFFVPHFLLNFFLFLVQFFFPSKFFQTFFFCPIFFFCPNYFPSTPSQEHREKSNLK